MNCNCCSTTNKSEENTLTLNVALKGDPTRTLSIRRKFVIDVNKRFSRLKRAINNNILGANVFRIGLGENVSIERFLLNANSDKHKEFMRWLERQEQRFILSKGTSGLELIRDGDQWTDIYIQSAYQKGIARARIELKKAGADVPTTFGASSAQAEVTAAFNSPFHIDRVQLAFTQTWTSMVGVNAAMHSQISRVLAQGMAEGRNPREIARSINDRVDKIGIARARTIARTETIRAHHSATIGEYKRAGIEGVIVKAEWLTAGDNRVCPACEALEGQIFTLDEAEGMIPLHPNCRCIMLPVVQEFTRKN